MRAQRGIRNAAEFVEVGAEIADRVELAGSPDRAAVRDYIMTRGAERAWSAFNQQLAGESSGFFWIGGAAGTGKTRFLNYVLALSERAGAIGDSRGRRLTLGFAAAASIDATELEQELAARIGRAVSGESNSLWRNLRGAHLIRVALDQAKRRGVAAITLALDFGESEPDQAQPQLAALAELTRTVSHPQLIVVAAGRADSPLAAGATFTVAAAADELVTTAIGRARQLPPEAADTAASAYDGIDLGEFEAERVYPFHPAAASALAGLPGAERLVAAVARMAQAAIKCWQGAHAPRHLIWPADLMAVAEIHTAVGARLGESGRAAYVIARSAARGMSEADRAPASEIVEVLVLHHVTAPQPALTFDEIVKHLGPRSSWPERLTGEELANLIVKLAAISGGVIRHDAVARTASFVERAAGAPEVAAFNAALDLMRRFDPTLCEVTEIGEVQVASDQIRAALAGALENAAFNRDLLRRAAGTAGGTLAPDQEQTFMDFIAAVERGLSALIAAAAHPAQRIRLEQTIRDYEVLATLAAAVPRLRAMREYLEAMGLHFTIEDDPDRDATVAKLETECKLLLVAVEATMQAKTTAGLDALESRFQRYKWTYVPFYRAAHDRWCKEMEAVASLIESGQRHLAALGRLNSISALGPPAGSELRTEFEAASRGLDRCTLEGPLAPEIMPCCPHCGYVIGTPLPRATLSESIARIRRALEAKLAILAQSAIARLIQAHDHNHRLEGFLKITQAAQTDALIGVLDDNLTRYLARLLDENLATDDGGTIARVVRPMRAARRGIRGQRRGKLPPGEHA